MSRSVSATKDGQRRSKMRDRVGTVPMQWYTYLKGSYVLDTTICDVVVDELDSIVARLIKVEGAVTLLAFWKRVEEMAVQTRSTHISAASVFKRMMDRVISKEVAAQLQQWLARDQQRSET